MFKGLDRFRLAGRWVVTRFIDGDGGRESRLRPHYPLQNVFFNGFELPEN